MNTENGITKDEEKAVEIVTDFFERTFNVKNQEVFPEVEPKEMTVPFTADEVETAINSLKNNKSAGIDDIVAEQLKYGPDIINDGIADILNDTAKSGNSPREIKQETELKEPK